MHRKKWVVKLSIQTRENTGGHTTKTLKINKLNWNALIYPHGISFHIILQRLQF